MTNELFMQSGKDCGQVNKDNTAVCLFTKIESNEHFVPVNVGHHQLDNAILVVTVMCFMAV